MATASDSSASVQSVNSVLDHHSRLASPCSFSSISDQKHVLDSEIFLNQLIAPPASNLAEDGQAEGSENVGVTKKCVWNNPANGVTPQVGAVMGTASWPDFSKSTRASTKDSSTDSLEELSHEPIILSKGTSVDSWSSQEVVNSIVSATNSASNHESPIRQYSPELGGDRTSHRNIAANGSFSQAPNSHSSVVEASPFNPGKSSISSGVSPRDNTRRDVGQIGGSHSGREPHHPRGPFRRNNSGPQLQGNGSSNHGHGSKRDQERWIHDRSNNHRSFGSRVNLAPQQSVASGPFIRGPVSSAPFIPPPTPVGVRPYGPPVFYNDASSFMYYGLGPQPGSPGHMPTFPYAPMLNPIPDPHLPSKIVNQIDYYFSHDNLVKDTFLRQKMDVDGWVPINLIANFKKIRELTDNVQLILDALRASNVVEIQVEKLRRKGNWRKWIMLTIMYPTGSSLRSLNISSLHIHDKKTNT
ncbi:la-related protein 1C-like isoform X2 [Primulina huaijiensis]|uniref:la-related protein 1C-like isoform X2 n=1 Tax=Primulina huaijiensis TaxID=1492673 RepID=UPI003CC76348